MFHFNQLQPQQQQQQHKHIFAPKSMWAVAEGDERGRCEQQQTNIDQLQSTSAAQIDTAVMCCVHQRNNTATHSF